jgi:hypothetical protein
VLKLLKIIQAIYLLRDISQIYIGEWTQKAIDNGYRSRLIEEFLILGFVEKGWITGPSGAPYGSAGIVVNCPIVYRFL